MKRKGIITSLLVMTMTGALLAGCGGKTSNSGKTEEKESTEKTESTEPEKTDIKLGITSGFTDFTDYIPDMMNYSYNANVYDIFADMLIYDRCFIEPKQQYCIGYAGRRNGLKYKHHSQQLCQIKFIYLEQRMNKKSNV